MLTCYYNFKTESYMESRYVYAVPARLKSDCERDAVSSSQAADISC